MFEFLEPIAIHKITNDNSFKEGQYGKMVDIYTENFPEWKNADIIIIGVHEERGKGIIAQNAYTDSIRRQLYNLYNWHTNITIADIGNIVIGKTVTDTYAALQIVLSELISEGKKVIILGNSHDLTMGQYQAYQKNKMLIEATCIDAKMDLSLETPLREERFLLEMLTGEPNYIRHYNHLGFQSYFVHPHMMDTLDKLRFDCYRVGKVRENITLFEPILRNSNMVSIDINALQNSVMPCNHITPNGFAGDEACMLTKYAGMSQTVSTLGIYNYNSTEDVHQIGATQIAQMIWYFIDGHYNLLQEKDISQKDYYNEFNTAFADINITFYQNKITNRWWMKLDENDYLPCSKEDYTMASQNEIPERWLRALERDI